MITFTNIARKRIHKEPGHEEDADAEQYHCEVWEHRWVDGAHIAGQALYGDVLITNNRSSDHISDF